MKRAMANLDDHHQAAASDPPTCADSDSWDDSRVYDDIGRRYTSTRHPDPRIGAVILDALGDADSVVNVGAGAGAYEPVGRFLIAVEPSRGMIRQRSSKAALVVQASAEALPFRAEAFDAALAVLTLHHWTDWRCGLDEMKRVANRLVVLTIEPTELGKFWLTEVYFPEIVALDRSRCPSTAEIEHHLGTAESIGSPFRTIVAMDSSEPSGVDQSRTSIRGYERECLASRCSTQTSLLEGLRSSSPISNRVRGSGASATSDRSTRSMSAIDSWSPIERSPFNGGLTECSE